MLSRPLRRGERGGPRKGAVPVSSRDFFGVRSRRSPHVRAPNSPEPSRRGGRHPRGTLTHPPSCPVIAERCAGTADGGNSSTSSSTCYQVHSFPACSFPARSCLSLNFPTLAVTAILPAACCRQGPVRSGCHRRKTLAASSRSSTAAAWVAFRVASRSFPGSSSSTTS